VRALNRVRDPHPGSPADSRSSGTALSRRLKAGLSEGCGGRSEAGETADPMKPDESVSSDFCMEPLDQLLSATHLQKAKARW